MRDRWQRLGDELIRQSGPCISTPLHYTQLTCATDTCVCVHVGVLVCHRRVQLKTDTGMCRRLCLLAKGRLWWAKSLPLSHQTCLSSHPFELLIPPSKETEARASSDCSQTPVHFFFLTSSDVTFRHQVQVRVACMQYFWLIPVSEQQLWHFLRHLLDKQTNTAATMAWRWRNRDFLAVEEDVGADLEICGSQMKVDNESPDRQEWICDFYAGKMSMRIQLKERNETLVNRW